MLCPSCGGEYREGFTTCADCQVALVESLPSEFLPPVRRGRSVPVPKIGSGLKDRWSELQPFARLLVVWCLIFTAVGVFSGIRDLRAIERYYSDYPIWLRVGLVLRTALLAILPLVCALGILRRARWAKIVCLVYLPIAALVEITIMNFLWRYSSQGGSSVIIESSRSSLVLPYLLGHLLVIVIDAAFFFLIQKRGFERAPAAVHPSDSIS